jgi:acetaldehyde dehydrogenase (acetylating)
MTARTTFEGSVATVGPTKINSVNAAELVRQEAINAVGVNVGANMQLGASNSQIASVKAAIAAKLASQDAADRAAQATYDAARQTLRATGDTGPN